MNEQSNARASASEYTSDAATPATCVRDYEILAQQRLSNAVWAYVHGASADGLSARRNQQAFEHWSLLPRVLRKASNGHTHLSLFGQRYEHPIFIAPTAYHALVHPDAERATALAASALQAGFVVSTQASTSLEAIAAITGIAPSPLWFQLYLQSQREISLDLVRRAENAGYKAIVLTVDAPIQGLRNEEQRQGFSLPAHIQAVNLQAYAHAMHSTSHLAAGASVFQHPLVQTMPDWDDLAWLVAHTRLPVLVKGILHPLDVQPALDAGAAGLIVSNHGGRTLDGVPATLDALPAIATITHGRVPIMLDGGIRRGTDILKALALGASAVLVGRPIVYGLAVAGASGAAHILNLLRTELEMAMVLSGVHALSDIDAGILCRSQQSMA